MAILSPSPSPSPLDSPPSSCPSPSCPSDSSNINGFRSFLQLLFSSECPEGQLLRIDMSVLLVGLFLLFLFLHGGIRQRIHAPRLYSVMRGIYLLVTVGVTYIMGLMHNSKEAHELFPIWAFSIIYVYGGVDNLTAYNLSDNEQALRYWLHILPLFYWAGWLSKYANQAADGLLVPLQVLYYMAIWNTTETLQAFYVASKSKGIPEEIWPVVRYMREERVDVPNRDEANPAVMSRGYRYLVWGDEPLEVYRRRTQRNCCSRRCCNCCCSRRCCNCCCSPSNNNDITTTEEIWNSTGRLLRSSNGTKGAGRADHLKDTCLSFALSKLLLTRFAGFTLDESSKQNTREFIEMELLSKDPKRCQIDRLFHVIEVELEFVFDFFYTKLYVLSTEKFWNKLRRICCALCFLWFAFYSLNHNVLKGEEHSITFHGHRVEAGVTRVFAVILAILEIWQLSMRMLSNWKIVRLLCEYVKEPNSIKGKRKEKEIQFIWTIKNCLSKGKFSRFFFKPWQRKLGQYSFIKSYYRVPIGRRLIRLFLCILVGLVKEPRVGQTGDFCVTLSVYVKQAIVSSLISNGLAMSSGPGIATLQRNGLLSQLSYACQLETDTDVILVWHIATSACGFSTQHKDEHFHVATQLSNYCAYLVTFAPELLHDHLYSTESVFSKAVEEAHVTFKGLNLDQRYQWMMTINEEEDTSTIVRKGAILARKLKDDVMEDPSKGWRVLAEFWAELLLYMAPSNNETAHGEHLAQGGEFITHLWALLTHAGVVARDSSTTTY